MSTLHKVKAYFGMAPMEDYDDEYYDDETDPRAATPAAVTVSATTATAERPAATTVGDYDDDDRPGGYRGGYPDEARFRPREFDRRGSARCVAPPAARWRWIPAGWRCCSTRAARCRRSPRCGPRTTARPTIGERFRDGTPVIMDLVSMDNADAKRLVDFAAGLAFALRGSFDKVATKVFLLSPPTSTSARRPSPHRRDRLLRLPVAPPHSRRAG